MYFSLNQLAQASGLAFVTVSADTKRGLLSPTLCHPTKHQPDPLGRFRRCFCVTPADISEWIENRNNAPDRNSHRRTLHFDSVVQRLSEITGIPEADIWDSMTPATPSVKSWSSSGLTIEDILGDDYEEPPAAPKPDAKLEAFLTSLLYEV